MGMDDGGLEWAKRTMGMGDGGTLQKGQTMVG